MSTKNDHQNIWVITVAQKNEKLMEEIKVWLEKQGFGPSLSERKTLKGMFEMSIHRMEDVERIARKIRPLIPSWHTKAKKLQRAIIDTRIRIAANKSHVEKGERDKLGRFNCGHTYTEYCLEDRTDDLSKLYLDETITIDEVCKRLGIGRTTLFRYAHRLKLKPRTKFGRKKKNIDEATRKRIANLYLEGVPILDISKECNIRNNTVYRALKHLKIPVDRANKTRFKKGNYPKRWVHNSVVTGT